MIAITSVGGRTSNGSTRLPSATQHPLRTAAMAMAALPPPKKGISGKRLAVSGLEEKRAKGNRRPDDWLGYPFSGLRPRPSGSRHGSSGSGSGPGLIDSALCPLSSIQSSIYSDPTCGKLGAARGAAPTQTSTPPILDTPYSILSEFILPCLAPLPKTLLPLPS